MQEEWKPIIIFGKEYNAYSVSNTGKIRSHFIPKRQVSMENGKIKSCRNWYEIDISYFKEKTPSLIKNADGTIKKYSVYIYFPKEFIKDEKYFSNLKFATNPSNDKYVIKTSVHKLVMDAFRPIDLFPPSRISKEDWERCPEDIKQILRESIIINHIDHNPANNNINNLEYVTPRENSIKARDYYGGNLVNKRLLTVNE